MTEDDLNYYYAQIELLWLTGFRTTFERIWDHLPPTERHVAHLTAGLATLVERNWLKVHEMPSAARAMRSSTRRVTCPSGPAAASRIECAHGH